MALPTSGHPAGLEFDPFLPSATPNQNRWPFVLRGRRGQNTNTKENRGEFADEFRIEKKILQELFVQCLQALALSFH